MWRIGIVVAGLCTGAIAGWFLLPDLSPSPGGDVARVAEHQLAGNFASDVGATRRVVTGGGLAAEAREQLSRDLFGAAAGELPAAAKAWDDSSDISRSAGGYRPPSLLGGAAAPPEVGRSGGVPLMAAAPAEAYGEAAAPAGRAGATGDIPEFGVAAQPSPAASDLEQRRAATKGAATAASFPSKTPVARPQSVEGLQKAARVADTASLPAKPAPRAAPKRESDPRTAEAQLLLASLGYAPGRADGRSGARTTAAIRAYEAASGLSPDGLIDGEFMARLRSDVRARGQRGTGEPPTAPASRSPTLASRILGGLQHLTGQDLDSQRAPEKLAGYCRDRADEWIYDRGQDRLRLCGDINGLGRVAYRPLPGDR